MKQILKFIICMIVIVAIILIANFEHKKQAVEQPKEVEEYTNVWTTSNVSVQKEPCISSKIVEKYPWNTELTVTYVDENWAKIKHTGYGIRRDFISESSASYANHSVPSSNTIKSYMDYRTITSTISRQYKLQQIANTDENGVRKVDDRYCVALGSYYTTKIGQYVDVELENGEVIQGVLADCKADNHTDSTNKIHSDGSVVEFVVDANRLNDICKLMGDVSYINNWNSKVVNVKVYDKVVKDF